MKRILADVSACTALLHGASDPVVRGSRASAEAAA